MARKVAPRPVPTAPIPPLRVGVPESARLLSISRSQLYKRIANGAIAVVKDGNRTLIVMDELRRYAAMNAA